jgi:hypothetical protein
MAAQKIKTADRFNKTEAGRQEIRARTHALSRSARNLLFIIDDTRPAAQWLTMIHGAGADDLQSLLQAHLVESVPGGRREPAEPPVADRPRARAATAAPSPPAVFATPLSYAEFHAGLTDMVREHLGLLKGYRISLEIERASGLSELVEVAMRFADEVHKLNGAAAAQLVRRTLNLPR